MKTKFESLKAEKFNALDVEQHQAVRGGNPRGTSGTGTISVGGTSYSYDGDVILDDGSKGYWVPKLVRYIYQ